MSIYKNSCKVIYSNYEKVLVVGEMNGNSNVKINVYQVHSVITRTHAWFAQIFNW